MKLRSTRFVSGFVTLAVMAALLLASSACAGKPSRHGRRTVAASGAGADIGNAEIGSLGIGDTHWFCGQVFKLKTPSKMASFLELDKILIKRLISKTEPLLAVFNQGSKFSEVNIPISFSAEKKTFVFSGDVITQCEDEDCRGLDSVKGVFEKGNGRGAQAFVNYLHATLHFYQDQHGKIKEWSEDLEYVGDADDGGWCSR